MDEAGDTENTSAVTILSSTHGRLRRAQRLIEKRDLQAAVRYGTRELTYNNRWKYTFADVVYITDITSTREITSWALPGSGLDVEKHSISAKAEAEHEEACRHILNDHTMWTSHTVIVVDQSGSMRKTDVEGGATRSDAVWLTIAIDFVAKQLEEKKASKTDVVSIVTLGRESHILVDRKPHNWTLYNTVIDLLRQQEPFFDGNYIPALDTAESLLLSNTYGSCALTLFLLSDGKPSDRLPPGTQTHIIGVRGGHLSLIGTRIDSLASRFGRRLSVITVGFAGEREDFSVLQDLAERPKQFGSNGQFFAVRLRPEALGSVFSSVTSSLNQTRTELTAVDGSSQRAVRDVRRKQRDTVGTDDMPSHEWFSYRSKDKVWNKSRLVYSHVKGRKFIKTSPIHPSATGVALHSSFFGEGAERLVREFREIGSDGMFVGPKLVAKESRFQIDLLNTDQRQIEKFHRSFCETQNRAQGLADVFNKRLEQLPCYNPQTMPKISFLSCSIYTVHDKNLGMLGMLVEKQLDPNKYKKWNDNCGTVDGKKTPEIETAGDVLHGTFAIIDECDEEDESDSEDEFEDKTEDDHIRLEDIPQAFSHFTYRYTKRKLLVCDLQGVLIKSSRPLFELTDPVIHFRSRNGRKNVFGRTDHGSKGINNFFRTHKCSPLCSFLTRRWVRQIGAQERMSHLDGLEERVSNLQL